MSFLLVQASCGGGGNGNTSFGGSGGSAGGSDMPDASLTSINLDSGFISVDSSQTSFESGVGLTVEPADPVIQVTVVTAPSRR